MTYIRPMAVFSIVVGIAMLSIWIIQIFTGQAPELETSPVEISLAITADCVTAVLLIISGIGLILQRGWSLKLCLFSLGMLVYSVLISSGYFGQTGDLTFVILFALIFVISILFLFMILFDKFKK